MCWLHFCQIDTNTGPLGRGLLNWGEKYIHKIGLLVISFIINDWCGQAQSIVGTAIPEKVVLNYIRE